MHHGAAGCGRRRRPARLEAGGVANVLFAAPGVSVAGLHTFAEEIMPAFEASPMVLAQV